MVCYQCDRFHGTLPLPTRRELSGEVTCPIELAYSQVISYEDQISSPVCIMSRLVLMLLPASYRFSGREPPTAPKFGVIITPMSMLQHRSHVSPKSNAQHSPQTCRNLDPKTVQYLDRETSVVPRNLLSPLVLSQQPLLTNTSVLRTNSKPFRSRDVDESAPGRILLCLDEAVHNESRLQAA